MLVGIVSDTHMRPGKRLPKALIDGLKGFDLILHAGDWVSLDVAEQLSMIAPVDGVAGNNDGDDIVRRFGYEKRLTLGSCSIGIVHGDGTRKTTEQRAFEHFVSERPDLIVFGHSHVPYQEKRDGIVLFNPGSPTDKRRQPQYSFGLLELTKEGWRLQHRFFDDKSE